MSAGCSTGLDQPSQRSAGAVLPAGHRRIRLTVADAQIHRDPRYLTSGHRHEITLGPPENAAGALIVRAGGADDFPSTSKPAVSAGISHGRAGVNTISGCPRT